MSESLSWMQTGDTLALSGELDQDVLLPLWEIREEAVKGITSIDLSRVSRVDTGGLALLAWIRVDWHCCSILSIWRKSRATM